MDVINNLELGSVVRTKLNNNFAEVTPKTSNYQVTVGTGGNFANLNDALVFASKVKAEYRKDGVLIEVKILTGFTVTSQIMLNRHDMSHVTITSVDAFVPVNSTGWTGITHDTRDNVPFIGGVYGARLPVIGTIFKWVAGLPAVGYYCNRLSEGVILPACGFDGFNDNVIANNNSEIVIRDAVAKNAVRWGIHARHISRISARSCNLTGCGISAYADRVSMIDTKDADMSGSTIAVESIHGSNITAQSAVMNNMTGTSYLVKTDYNATINVSFAFIDTVNVTNIFDCKNGSSISVFGTNITNYGTSTWYSLTPNLLSVDGTIFAGTLQP